MNARTWAFDEKFHYTNCILRNYRFIQFLERVVLSLNALYIFNIHIKHNDSGIISTSHQQRPELKLFSMKSELFQVLTLYPPQCTPEFKPYALKTQNQSMHTSLIFLNNIFSCVS